jgi:hypothetical protein
MARLKHRDNFTLRVKSREIGWMGGWMDGWMDGGREGERKIRKSKNEGKSHYGIQRFRKFTRFSVYGKEIADAKKSTRCGVPCMKETLHSSLD